MGDAVTITLPLPSSALHAHAKGGWRSKTKPTRDYRNLAGYLALEASRGRRPRWESAVLSLRFWWPDNRRRDELNAAHGCKPAIDGFVDAGIITDDCWQVLRIGGIECGIDRVNPRVELTIRKGGA